jgi:HK97 family phage prohead protease
MASAARKGLAFRAEGYGGDGLADRTLREARQIADGQMSDDKVIRANAWAARHAVDLEAPQNSDGNHPDYPGAGAVAHYLWGIDPTDPGPARRWLEREAERIREEEGRSMTGMETRTFTVNDLEVREAPEGMSFEGYAAVFNSPSEPLPFTETIAPGAFARSLKSRNNVFLLVNHDPARPLASTRSKTMTLEEDGRGLLVKATLPDTTDGRDLAVLLGAGGAPRVIDSMSFGFSVPRGGDKWNEDGSQRTLQQVRLHETSIVTFPAYQATSAAVRSLDMLAEATGEDADALNGALEALERGATLTMDQAGLLSAVVAKLSPEPQPEPVVEPVAHDASEINLLKTKLDLAFKA